MLILHRNKSNNHYYRHEQSLSIVCECNEVFKYKNKRDAFGRTHVTCFPFEFLSFSLLSFKRSSTEIIITIITL